MHFTQSSWILQRNGSRFMISDGISWIPGSVWFACISLGFSTVEDVFAARWRPQSAFWAPRSGPRAHFSESYMKFMFSHEFNAKMMASTWFWCDFVCFTWKSWILPRNYTDFMISDGKWWDPGNAKFLCNSLGFSTVEEVFAARWRPQSAFRAPWSGPRAHFG